MPKVNLRIAARRDGFILVTVLWILAALSALASVYAVYISNTAMAAHSYASRVEADALVRAALELAAYQLMGDDATRPTSSRSPSTALLGGSRVDFMFQSEGARLALPRNLQNESAILLFDQSKEALGAKAIDGLNDRCGHAVYPAGSRLDHCMIGLHSACLPSGSSDGAIKVVAPC